MTASHIFNPFMPNSIVHPDMFAGRGKELKKIERCLAQTKHGNPNSFLIHGERGIGKSSLLLFADKIASGVLENYPYKFITINIELDSSDSQISVIRKLSESYISELSAAQPEKSMLKNTFKFMSAVEVAGFKWNPKYDKDEPSDLLEQLSKAIQQGMLELRNEKDGLLFLIDEADKAPSDAQLGAIIKTLSEKISKGKYQNVCFGVSGVTEVLQTLKKSHESSLRLFEDLPLYTLSFQDRLDLIERGLSRANHHNDKEIEIRNSASSMLAQYSEGLPHFLQQYGYSSFEINSDLCIDESDVIEGIFSKGGALDQLGMKYFNDMYFEQINSDNYRIVLRYMAEESSGEYVSRGELISGTQLKPRTIDNAVAALSKRGIIYKSRSRSGSYRLCSLSFAFWILTKNKDLDPKSKQLKLKFEK